MGFLWKLTERARAQDLPEPAFTIRMGAPTCITKTVQEPDFICTIVLASLHPAHLPKISWVMDACGEAGAVAV
jgi:hypothetical protein